MLVGRRDGPRLEARASGMRLIGFSHWPEETRLASNGRPLKRSYAERVDAVAKELGPWQRAREFAWEEVVAVDVRFTELHGRGVVQGTNTPFARTLALNVFHVLGLGSDPDVLGFRRSKVRDGWTFAPQAGWARVVLTARAGEWRAQLPLDTPKLASKSAERTVRQQLLTWIADPASRADLPLDWPTGRFRRGLDDAW